MFKRTPWMSQQARPYAGVLLAILAAILLNGCATSDRNVTSFESRRDVPGIWPIACSEIRITSRFGDRTSTGSGGSHTHSGLDISAPKGTPVLATANGCVSYAKYNKGGYGRLVKIEHPNGIETLYAHLDSFDVKEGKPVRQGQRIGTVGKSGRATGFHLHYEVRVNGKAVDPMPYLPARR